MNKKNLLRLLTIMIVAVLSVGFVSCDDDDNNKVIIIDPPVQTTDGLEGYWLLDFNKTNDEDTPAQKFFYLDGQGGGTYYNWAIRAQYRGTAYTNKIGVFKDYEGHTDTYYCYRQPVPLTYYKTGSTITMVMNGENGVYNDMVNVGEDGNISEFHRVTKVE